MQHHWPRLKLHALLALILLLPGSGGISAYRPAKPLSAPLAPQIAAYQIDARLDPLAKTITGTERISYTNPSADTLSEIWLRLYLRAFRSSDTIWMREKGYSGQLQADMVGDINISTLALAGGADLLASATLTDTLMRVPLPQPLGPGQRLDLDVAWVSKLPRVFERTGYGGKNDSFFMVGQWYPKLAVYERGRWDSEPWHANAEFFNDFGSYDVHITAPSAYVLAGAGVPAGAVANPNGSTTSHYSAEDVTDFAFAASPDFQVRASTAGEIDIALYLMPEHSGAAESYLSVAAEALTLYGAWYGPYPHPRLTIVDVPDNASAAGGMEYPTLITSLSGTSPANYSWLAYVTSHEIGHQWWPMQTATNEAAEPWLDEGLTEYSGVRYMVESRRWWSASDALAFEQRLYAPRTAFPATLPAWQYSANAYTTVYAKTALGLWTLEGVVGSQRFRSAMAAYLAAYRYKHPHGADFRASLEQSLGGLGWLFDDYLGSSGTIDYTAGPIENTASGSMVQVQRKGAVRAPVDVRITFINGEQLQQTWDGQSSNLRLSFPAGQAVAHMEVDPDDKLKAELNRQDNRLGVWRILMPISTRK